MSESESSSLTSEGGSSSLSSELESESEEDPDLSWGAESTLESGFDLVVRVYGRFGWDDVVACAVRSRGGVGEGRGC